MSAPLTVYFSGDPDNQKVPRQREQHRACDPGQNPQIIKIFLIYITIRPFCKTIGRIQTDKCSGINKHGSGAEQENQECRLSYPAHKCQHGEIHRKRLLYIHMP